MNTMTQKYNSEINEVQSSKYDKDSLMEFKTLVQTIYNPIHDEKRISNTFGPLSVLQLNALIEIYNDTPLLRWKRFYAYLVSEKIISKKSEVQFVVPIYINAIQHYLTD